MSQDIPFKKLNAKQAQDIAKAMCRNDAKRLQDVLDRVGGIDSSAFQLLLDPADHPNSLLYQERASPGLFVRTLARSPDEAFDWLVGSLADSQSFAWSRALDFGAGRDPRVTQRIFEAHARSGLDIDEDMVNWIDVFRDSERQAQGARQNAQWSAQRQAVDELCHQFLMGLGAERLGEIRAALVACNGPSSVHDQLIDTALAHIERQEISDAAPGLGEPTPSVTPARKKTL